MCVCTCVLKRRVSRHIYFTCEIRKLSTFFLGVEHSRLNFHFNLISDFLEFGSELHSFLPPKPLMSTKGWEGSEHFFSCQRNILNYYLGSADHICRAASFFSVTQQAIINFFLLVRRSESWTDRKHSVASRVGNDQGRRL